VETFDQAKILLATDPANWQPKTKEAADHSIPFVVAVGLSDGFIGPDQFDDAHINDPLVRRLVETVEVVEKTEYSSAYRDPPHLHCARVTVFESDGTVRVGESGGVHGELGTEWDDAGVEEKFARLTAGHIDAHARREVLDRLWALEDHAIAELPPLLISQRVALAQAAG
jgi:2-methylcitrate dehydratase